MRRLVLVTLLLALGCPLSPTPYTAVVVATRDGQVLRHLETAEDLEQFRALWLDRSDEPMPESAQEWYEVMIYRGERYAFWLYSPDGSASRITVKAGNEYRIRDPAALNRLVGIESDA